MRGYGGGSKGRMAGGRCPLVAPNTAQRHNIMSTNKGHVVAYRNVLPACTDNTVHSPVPAAHSGHSGTC
jgi:hypothetical protein